MRLRDFRLWLDKPGTYQVDCVWEGELVPDTNDWGRWPEHAHEVWDVKPGARLSITVPPR